MKLFGWIFIIFLFLVISTPWLGWEEGIDYLQANDVKSSYEKISSVAPHFPAETLARHHAQRFFWPYLLGSVSKWTGIDTVPFYRVGLVFFYGLLVWGLISSLQALDVPKDRQSWAICILFLNPYFFRYYWIVPGMLADVAFLCFSVWLASFAIRKKHFPLLLCLVGALLSRQTTIFLIPALVIWFFWQRESARDLALRVSSTLFTFALVYLWINHTVSPFSEPDNNVGILFSLMNYFQGGQANAFAIGELLLRVFLPLSVPLAIFLLFFGRKAPAKVSLFLLLGMAGVAAQPILGGPVITGKNAGRLAALALPWLVIALCSLRIPFPRNGKKSAFLVGFLALGSLHHLYSVPSLPNQAVFVVVHLLSVCLVALAVYDLREKDKLSEF